MDQRDYQDRVAFLAGTPEAVRQLVDGLSDAELRRKPSEREFSILEHVCHLGDLEREGYAARISRLLAESEPVLPDFDGDKLAEERNYNEQRLETRFEEFAGARSDNVRVLQSLSAAQLRRTGTLEHVGAITLEELVKMMCEHDHKHRKVLTALRERAPS